MALNFRIAALSVAVVGLALGVAFGAGVAYGRGDPQTVESGLTQQQIQSLLGIGGAPAAGAQGSGTPTQGAGTPTQQRPQAAAGGAGANATFGRVTSVDGNTVTIQTAQGEQKVTLGASTSVSRIASGSASDLTTGLTIFATGSRKEDGSFEAASISQLPPEVQALLSGAAGGQMRTP